MEYFNDESWAEGTCGNHHSVWHEHVGKDASAIEKQPATLKRSTGQLLSQRGDNLFSNSLRSRGL
jgi:hypothetical protein